MNDKDELKKAVKEFSQARQAAQDKVTKAAAETDRRRQERTD